MAEAPRQFERPPEPGPGRLETFGTPDVDMLRSIFDAVPGRVAVVGRDHRYHYVNHQMLAFLGRPLEAVLGHTLAEVVGEQNFQTYLAVAERLFAGEPVRWEGWTQYPGVGRRYVQHHWMPYRAHATAEVSAMIAMGHDLTELKEQEARLAAQLAALEQTEALKSAIVDHALAAVVVADIDDVIVEFNPAAVAMFGVAREDAIGRRMATVIIPPRLRERYRLGMASIAAGDPDQVLGRRIQRIAQRADGSEFAAEAAIWRVEVDGRTYWTASVTDRSEARAAAEQIERQREQLRQSEKLAAMGSLLAGVAHELNNPLAIVLGRASLLEEKLGEAARAGDAADARRIREAAERCGRIVRAFLNMARQRPATRGPVRVNELVQAAVELLGYTLRSHGIAVELQLDDGLPTLQADADQLGQVVLNLIVNAQQVLSTLDGSRRLLLRTGAAAGTQWVTVADSGPGVAVALRERIFEPFFTTKGEGLGTGLGLSVSRGIARSHGGELSVEDGPDGGAVFRLVLPPGGAAVAAGSEPAAAAVRGAARVLVVDDEPEIAELVRALLHSAGHAVEVADSGAAALQQIDHAHFDAIVSDLRMPDIDGAALWRAVQQRDAGLARRMLFVTGDTLSPAARQFLQTARCAALDKPFGKTELLAAVQRLLED